MHCRQMSQQQQAKAKRAARRMARAKARRRSSPEAKDVIIYTVMLCLEHKCCSFAFWNTCTTGTCCGTTLKHSEVMTDRSKTCMQLPALAASCSSCEQSLQLCWSSVSRFAKNSEPHDTMMPLYSNKPASKVQVQAKLLSTRAVLALCHAPLPSSWL